MEPAGVSAALSATPIGAYDVEWHRELIRHGETGLLVPYRDFEATARAVLWLLDHREEGAAMGERARRAAVERYEPAVLLRRERTCFERLLGEGRV